MQRTHARVHARTHAPTHPPTHPPTHALTHAPHPTLLASPRPITRQYLGSTDWITLDMSDKDYWDLGVRKLLTAIDGTISHGGKGATLAPGSVGGHAGSARTAVPSGAGQCGDASRARQKAAFLRKKGEGSVM